MKNIFSTGIEVHHLEGIDNERMVDYAEKYSLRGRGKEVKDILNNPLFFDLNNIVHEKMNEYYSQAFNDKYYMELDEAWANVDNDPLICIPHTHKCHFLAAVYYPLSTDGAITFLNPMPHLITHTNFKMIGGGYNEYNSDYYVQYVKTGDLVIFNALLHHFAGFLKDKRISIAYNGVCRAK